MLRDYGSGKEKIIPMDHFDIHATHDFRLIHGNTPKNLRFICMKGKVIDNEGLEIVGFTKIPHRMVFWKNHEEFAAHASNMKPIGWEDRSHRGEKKTSAVKPLETVSLVNHFTNIVNLSARRQLFTSSVPATEPPKKKRKKNNSNNLIEDMAGCSDDDSDSEEEGDSDEDSEDQAFIDNDEPSHNALDFERDNLMN